MAHGTIRYPHCGAVLLEPVRACLPSDNLVQVCAIDYAFSDTHDLSVTHAQSYAHRPH